MFTCRETSPAIVSSFLEKTILNYHLALVYPTSSPRFELDPICPSYVGIIALKQLR